ncbi:MAG TPA: hypothetical protein VGF94_08070 [Kofleriaceae bacterium]|jgi:hypothetical protein
MKRVALVALLIACGCRDYRNLSIDARASPDALAGCSPEPYTEPPGCSCNPDAGVQFCNGGDGWCTITGSYPATCRAFCSPTSYPRCPAGEAEQHMTYQGADQCVCVPSS